MLWGEVGEEMSDDLKPCPFCGGKAELSNSMVSCMFCLCCLPDSYGYEGNGIGFPTEAEAIAAWNNRADADRIEQLEAKLIIAVAYIRRHIPDSIYEQRQQARAVLAKLEGKE